MFQRNILPAQIDWPCVNLRIRLLVRIQQAQMLQAPIASSRFLSLWFFSVLQVLGGGRKGYICESQVDIIIPLQLALV